MVRIESYHCCQELAHRIPNNTLYKAIVCGYFSQTLCRFGQHMSAGSAGRMLGIERTKGVTVPDEKLIVEPHRS